MLKNQKGITLVALVITIIVLLILAGVTISMVLGQNGILNQANSAKAETAKATVLEQVQSAVLAQVSTYLQTSVLDNSDNGAALADYMVTELKSGTSSFANSLPEGYALEGEPTKGTGDDSAVTVEFKVKVDESTTYDIVFNALTQKTEIK